MTGVVVDVSRETLEKLNAFAALAEKWTKKINLISRSSVGDLWTRHILDSLQIAQAGPPSYESWTDLGSGGGFPGVVVAILSAEMPGKPQITLVESDARKCAFLRAALRETDTMARVLNERIEPLPPMQSDVISARALADLNVLLGFADRHMKPSGTAIFPKGAQWKSEVTSARATWNFGCDAVKSNLDADAAILKITGISRA